MRQSKLGFKNPGTVHETSYVDVDPSMWVDEELVDESFMHEEMP